VSNRVLPLYGIGPASWAETQSLYHAQAHLGQPALNIIWPEQPYVCIGRFQDLEAEVDVTECERRGLPIMRREVGGGAVYLDGNQVFYQLVLPISQLGRHYKQRRLFQLGLEGVALALKMLGINAGIRGANDVVVGQRKISGNGAGEVGQAAVVVGNILVDFDYETMAAVLRVPDEKFRDKAYRSMRKNLVTLRQLGWDGSNEQVGAVMAEAFAKVMTPSFPVQASRALPNEVLSYVPAVTRRLTAKDWLYAVQRRRYQRRLRIRQGLDFHEKVWKAPGGLLRCHYAVEDGRLAWVALSGDIFVHPPDALQRLEEILTGLGPGQVKEAAARFLAQPDVEMPGISPSDIENVVASWN